MLGSERKGGLLVFVERKCRFVRIKKLIRRTAEKTAKATVKVLKDLPVKTITNDRGLEFQAHKEVERNLKAKVFFCHPYSSNERGSNENRIGVISQYLPKKTRLLNLTWYQIKKIENEINNRPMKCLNWRSPLEAFSKQNIKMIT